ncbi:MAG TPA: pyruvate formate lyase family protein [Desulfosporosinus sp.]|nr:pyruvate formate lyase family protein [Desulfosporosinus sp.]
MDFSAEQIAKIVNQVMEHMGDVAPQANGQTDDDYLSQLGTGGLEPFDKSYAMIDYKGEKEDISPFQRINRIRKRVFDTVQELEAHRAVLLTEAYKLYKNEPQVIKCAKAMAYLYRKLPIHVMPDEIVAGETGCLGRHAGIYPEFSYDWVIDELRDDRISRRPEDRYQIPQNVKKSLLDLEDYWIGNTVADEITGLLTDEELKGSTVGGRPVFTPNLFYYYGSAHTMPRFELILADGYSGRKKKIAAALEKCDPSTAQGLEARENYLAQLIVLDGASDHMRRYATLAREQTATENNAARKRELVQIAENFDWIAENPPQTFWQAIQLYQMTVCLGYIESNGQALCFGRLDQVLYPFYEADMKAGRITKKFAAELIEAWSIKTWEMLKLRDEISATLSSEAGMGSTTTIGGLKRDGSDATNDLTYLMLEAHAHTQLQEPWLSCRWHINSPWEYKVKIANILKIGTGLPKIFNDDACIPAQLSAGKQMEDAREYAVVGCVELDIPGKEYGAHDSAYMSLPKVFEMALNDGRCLDCGSGCPRWQKCGGIGGRLGPQYGGLNDFTCIEDLMEAYRKQMEYWVDKMVAVMNATEIAQKRKKPLPYLSSVFEGPLESGKDVTAGGAVYNFSGPQGVGMATVGDSLCVINELVFKNKQITVEKLLDALQKNWLGYENLYTLVNSDKIPHYGNNNDYADEFTKFAAKCWIDAVHGHMNTRGGKIVPGMFSVSANVGIGMWQAATPDGRLAMEPVSNCLGPVHTKVGCHDTTGPTAMAISAGKLDQQRACNGTLLNVRFSPSCVAGDSGRDKLVRYIDTYFQHKGMEVQFNIVDHQTLLEAQAHPEDYKGLLVRVAGYSALFTRLSKPLQDDLIGRNAYTAFD